MRVRRFEKVEGLADMATLVVIGALGLAMLIGLATASGAVNW